MLGARWVAGFFVIDVAEASWQVPLPWEDRNTDTCTHKVTGVRASFLALQVYVDDPSGSVFSSLCQRGNTFSKVVLVWIMSLRLAWHEATRGPSVLGTCGSSLRADTLRVLALARPQCTV